MKYLLVIILSYFYTSPLAAQVQSSQKLALLKQYSWNSGASFCFFNDDPAIEVYQYNKDSYILRQSKCLHYEAPFIYVLFGEHSVFIQDTGATENPDKFPLYKLVMELVSKHAIANNKLAEQYKIIVSHSHSHGDHTAADKQFSGKTNVTLIEPTQSGVRQYFGFGENKLNWPTDMAQLDLGNRKLSILPIPGHQGESIAVYDAATQWLLTGDTLYPGRLYVKDWQSFQASIKRLVDFSTTQPISAVMGTHIEMSKVAGIDYAMGSTNQENEVALPLPLTDLLLLNSLLQTHSEPKKITTDRFIIYPVN